LRKRLGEEGASGRFAFSRLPSPRFPLAAAAALIIALTFGLAYGLYLLQQRPVVAAELSPALMGEAAGDHTNCAIKFINHQGQLGPARMSESAKRYDPAYADLDKVAEAGAAGMELRSAHVCGFAGRRFAHLVYGREEHIVSLLVTERDQRAMRRGVVPEDDGLRAGLQQALRDRYTVSAYQTAKRVVLVVSDLPEQQNKELAERIASPVCDHLRRQEAHPKAFHRRDFTELVFRVRKE
jgi:hypothetical protein